VHNNATSGEPSKQRLTAVSLLLAESSGFRAASRRTAGSGNVNADIDESLFGANSTSGGRKSAPSSRGGNGASSALGRNGTAIISDQDLRNIMALTGGGARGGFAATQQQQQFQQQPTQSFSQTGGIPSSMTASASSSTLRATSASSASKAQARKEKMARLAREAAARPPPLTASEFEEKENRSRLMSHAKQIIDEEMDDVKHMNQMMMYAQCVTIRDAQILEKVTHTHNANKRTKEANLIRRNALLTAVRASLTHFFFSLSLSPLRVFVVVAVLLATHR
jgi:hypothetical protein